MKIKFIVKPDKKEIIFFFKNGCMESFARELIKKFPCEGNENLAKIGSQHLAEPMLRFIQFIEQKSKVPVSTYKPRFVCYQRNIELPRNIRKM